VLGVTQYLSRAAIEALFRFAASLSVQSEIVLSFAPDQDLYGDDLAAAIHSITLTDGMGEPWRTRLSVSEAFDLLTRLGFGEVFHLRTTRLGRLHWHTPRRDARPQGSAGL
jgi:O-methyltransferase involved in polyketide biosynthesis